MQQRIHVLARAVIINDNHILLARDPRPKPQHYYELGKSFHYLPGGHIDAKESAKDAVLREIKEETGYSGEYERFLGAFEHFWNFVGDEKCCHTHEINLIFKINIPELNPSIPIIQQEEHVALDWINLKDLSVINLRPVELKTLIPEWLDLDLNNALKSSAI